MGYHKTRKNKSRSKKNKTRGGAKGLGRRTPSYKEKRRSASTTTSIGSSHYAAKKVSLNSKNYSHKPKTNKPELSEYNRQIAAYYGVELNKD